VVGPALAGVVLLAGSATWAFTVNALSFGAVVVALFFVRLPARATVRGGTIVGRIAEGARTAAAEPGCRSAILLIGIVALVGSPFIALVPAVAIDALHRGVWGTTVLVTAQGIGAVCGALALAPLALRLGRRLVVGALVAFPLALIPYGLAPGLWSAAAAIGVVGGCYIGVLTGLNTVVQRRAPAQARGRVLGLYMMTLGVFYAGGAVGEGALAHEVGIRTVTTAAGAVLVGIVVVLVLTRRPLFAALEGLPAQAADAPGTGAPINEPPRTGASRADARLAATGDGVAADAVAGTGAP